MDNVSRATRLAAVTLLLWAVTVTGCGDVRTLRGTYIWSSDPPEAYDRERGLSHKPPREPWQL